jgi:hypothetical protein
MRFFAHLECDKPNIYHKEKYSEQTTNEPYTLGPVNIAIEASELLYYVYISELPTS